ncbi:hypothetical protein MSG28_002363, partial [Choristoneura fumiferana]
MASDLREIEINDCLSSTSIYDYADCDIQIVKDIEYEKFYEDFLYKNLPCVIRNTSSHWECSTKWMKSDSIDCDYFMNNFSQLEAPVADCDKIVYNAQTKQILTVIDFMKYLESEERDTLLYLKDWHLKKLRPNDNFYEVPSIFGSDWLNEYAQDHNEDDFIWSVNVIGRKKWTLFPPGEEEKFKDPLGNLPLLFEYDKYKNVRYFEIIQEKGDAIFVPSGWHHQVTNELDTISINHNWVNACNIEEVWKALEKSLKSVEHEIEEFKDTPEFVDQCQLILKSMFGMDFEHCINFILYIAKKRLGQLYGENPILFNKYTLGKNHVLFDLKKLQKVIDLFDNHPL